VPDVHHSEIRCSRRKQRRCYEDRDDIGERLGFVALAYRVAYTIPKECIYRRGSTRCLLTPQPIIVWMRHGPTCVRREQLACGNGTGVVHSTLFYHALYTPRWTSLVGRQNLHPPRPGHLWCAMRLGRANSNVRSVPQRISTALERA